MDSNMKREIILDHYQNPRNKGLKNEGFVSDMDNESCIDHVIVESKIEDGKLKDIHFDGEACAICTSSASIMTEVLNNKTIEESKTIINNFSNMINNKEYDSDILEEANVYSDIANQPNRKKCALLAWWAIDELIEKNK